MSQVLYQYLRMPEVSDTVLDPIVSLLYCYDTVFGPNKVVDILLVRTDISNTRCPILLNFYTINHQLTHFPIF